jgi:hypothetical protein
LGLQGRFWELQGEEQRGLANGGRVGAETGKQGLNARFAEITAGSDLHQQIVTKS